MENWKENLQKTKEYIDENFKTPNDRDKCKKIKTLGRRKM